MNALDALPKLKDHVTITNAKEGITWDGIVLSIEVGYNPSDTTTILIKGHRWRTWETFDLPGSAIFFINDLRHCIIDNHSRIERLHQEVDTLVTL